MYKQLVAILAGLAVAFVVSFGLSFALASAGAEPGYAEYMIGAALGTMTSAIMLNLAGNRKVKAASDDERTAAVNLQPKDGHGLVVLYREGWVASGVGLDISIDGQDVTQVKGKRFTAVNVAPGRHRLEAKLAGAANAHAAPGVAEFDLPAGGSVVLRATIKMKLTTGEPVLTRIDDLAAAKATLAKMRMVAPA